MNELRAKNRVLVVDDEHVIADTLCAILKLAGFQASATYSGKDAIALAKSTRPDFVISDVAMPGINGIEAVIQIQSILPDCKILLFSGHAGTVDLLQDARERGYDFDIVAKPFHPDELIARLSS